GIAQGTFYNFFNSKELLYFAILELEENKLTKQLLEINFSKESSAKEIMKQTLQKLVKEIETNALIRELFQDNNMEKLVRKLPRSEEHTSELQSRFELVCRLLLEREKSAQREAEASKAW